MSSLYFLILSIGGIVFSCVMLSILIAVLVFIIRESR